ELVNGCFLHVPLAHPRLPSFPTRRSSDLPPIDKREQRLDLVISVIPPLPNMQRQVDLGIGGLGERQSARLTCSGSWVRRRLRARSEEHTSELQSRENLVCRLLLEENKPEG